MKNFFFLILLHLIGDYVLQTGKIARCKNAAKCAACGDCHKCDNKEYFNLGYVVVHVLVYVIPFLSLFFFMSWQNALLCIGFLFVTHVVIDSVSCTCNKKFKGSIVLSLDQLVHVGVLYAAYRLFPMTSMGDGATFGVYVAIALLIVMNPAAIFIDKLFEDVFKEKTAINLMDSSCVIGMLERVMVLVFAYFNSFATIAIIITIKTWARSAQLKEDKDFRNKYLLGTLASLVIALLTFGFFKVMMEVG